MLRLRSGIKWLLGKQSTYHRPAAAECILHGRYDGIEPAMVITSGTNITVEMPTFGANVGVDLFMLNTSQETIMNAHRMPTYKPAFHQASLSGFAKVH